MIKLSLRKMKTRKPYPLLLIIGLALGMASLMFMSFWMSDERGYDVFHEKHDRIFLVLTEHENGGTTADSSLLLGPELKKALPEIEDFCRIRLKNASLIGQRFHEQSFSLADPSLFKIFTFPFVKGDPNSALSELNSIVMTEDTATRHFGNEDPMGKTLHVRQFDAELTVTGVIKNIPRKSHFRFDLVARIEWMGEERLKSRNPSCVTYVLLKETDFQKSADRNIHEALTDVPSSGGSLAIHLHPLARIHQDGWDKEKSFQNTRTFLVISIVILLLACINGLNLNTSGFVKNATDIGVRKTFGARRIQIMAQHISESIFYSSISFLIAYLIILMSKPLISHFLGGDIGPSGMVISLIIVMVLGIVPAAGIISGFYPAVILSSIPPDHVLKGQYLPGKRGTLTKKALITLQFSVAVGLVLCSIIVYRQLNLIKTHGVGFDTESTLVIPNQVPFDAFKERLLEDPGIKGVTAGSSRPVQVRDEVRIRLADQGPESSITAAYAMVDFDFFETLGMEFVSGGDFREDLLQDMRRACIINESLARRLGIASSVGKRIYFDHPAFAKSHNELDIIGVIKDFYFGSMHQAVEPFIFRFHRPWHYLIFAKIKPENVRRTLANIERIFKELNPGYPFSYEFLEDSFHDLYRSEVLIGVLLIVFGTVALLIACIGLFGLASSSAELKTKEIGIRKTFGASIPGLVGRLSRELTTSVFLANLAAWPIVFFLMDRWLDSYAPRISLSIGPFLLTGIVTQILAFLTVSLKTFKMANANPIKALRSE